MVNQENKKSENLEPAFVSWFQKYDQAYKVSDQVTSNASPISNILL